MGPKSSSFYHGLAHIVAPNLDTVANFCGKGRRGPRGLQKRIGGHGWPMPPIRAVKYLGLVYTSPNSFPSLVERPKLPWRPATLCGVSRAKAPFSAKVGDSIEDWRANVHFTVVKRRTFPANGAVA